MKATPRSSSRSLSFATMDGMPSSALCSLLSPSLGQIPHPVSDILPPADRSAPSQSPSPCSICRWSHQLIVLPDPESAAHRRSYRSKDATQFQTSEDLRSEHPTLWRRRKRKRREPFVCCLWVLELQVIANTHTPYCLQSVRWSIRSVRVLQGSLPCAFGESMLYGAHCRYRRGVGESHTIFHSPCAQLTSSSPAVGCSHWSPKASISAPVSNPKHLLTLSPEALFIDSPCPNLIIFVQGLQG